MRFLSVCSGIEAASVAWQPLGWEAVAFSEIEPFPCAVLKHHYPDVPNLGDMTRLPWRIASGEVEALDALCDREVTGNGVAFLAGMDKDGADKAVLDSNDAKLVDGKPVILPDGKIGKPPGWTPPNLAPFV